MLKPRASFLDYPVMTLVVSSLPVSEFLRPLVLPTLDLSTRERRREMLKPKLPVKSKGVCQTRGTPTNDIHWLFCPEGVSGKLGTLQKAQMEANQPSQAVGAWVTR